MRRASASAPRQAADLGSQPSAAAGREARRWQRPAFEVIALDCEITAYAPAGDEPLF